MVELFGILPENQYLKLLLDLLIITAFILTYYSRKNNQRQYTEFQFGIMKHISHLFILFMLVAMLTLIRGGVDLIDIYKFSRIYIPYLLIYSISYDCLYNNNLRYYEKIVIVFAIIVTVNLFLISVLQLDYFRNLPRIGVGFQRDQYDVGLLRVYMYSSFLFPIIGFITVFYHKEWKKSNRIILLIILSIGTILQGYRSYIWALIISILLTLLLCKEKKSATLKVTKYILGILLFFSFLAYTNSSLAQRITSGIYDIIHMKGTFEARVYSDNYRFNIFFTDPILGIGFVHNDSQKACELGASTSVEIQKQQNTVHELNFAGNYSLQSTDSGYLNLLLQFGIFGIVVFLYIYYKILKKLIKFSQKAYNSWVASSITMIFVIIITQITHSGFTNNYGLLPLVIILSFAHIELVKLSFNK